LQDFIKVKNIPKTQRRYKGFSLYCALFNVSIFPGKKFPEKREEIKRPGNPGISRLNRDIFAISRDFPSREFPGKTLDLLDGLS
jgi:hypothetical protein